MSKRAGRGGPEGNGGETDLQNKSLSRVDTIQPIRYQERGESGETGVNVLPDLRGTHSENFMENFS